MMSDAKIKIELGSKAGTQHKDEVDFMAAMKIFY